MREFVERTTTFRLDPWQVHMCAMLQRAVRPGAGTRLLIHAPPQSGKSIVVSQRLAAYILAMDPINRVRLACYNKDHAGRFGAIIRDLMRERTYRDLTASQSWIVGGMPAESEWNTQARAELRDAQPSFLALGLVTGFVGQGADTLIIDDPYASPQDAYSEATRSSVMTFWNDGASVRITEKTNVIVMFHRYHEDDIAGELWRMGGWKMLRYAAREDGDKEWPCSPPGREVGEKLSPRYTEKYYVNQEKNGFAWHGQFQGRPQPIGGGLIKSSYFRRIAQHFVPPLLMVIMGADLAVSAKTTADYTVAFPLGIGKDGNFYLFRPARGQWEPPDARDAIIAHIQSFPGKPLGPGPAGKPLSTPFIRRIGVESVASGSGYVSELRRDKRMKGYPVVDIGRNSDKVTLAAGWLPFAAQGRLYLVDDGTGWEDAFLKECESFPNGSHDDQVDGLGICFETIRRGALSKIERKPKEDRKTRYGYA